MPLDDDSQHLTVMMTEMVTKMQVLLDKQDELGENIAKIKEAVYNPDSGLYARLRSLEQWRDNTSKINWFISTTVAVLAIQTIWDLFIT